MKLFTRLSLRLLALLVVLIGLAPAAHAQAPAWQMARAISSTATSASFFVQATAADSSGNLYLTGGFYGTISIGGIPLTSVGGQDIFIAKWIPAANSFAWAQRAGGADFDRPNALTVSGANVYVAGTYSGATANFGSTVLPNAATNANAYDAFVTKLSATGSFVWTQRAGGAGTDSGTSVAVSGTSVYLGGAFSGPTASFGSITLANSGSNSAGTAYDGYVAKLTDSGTTAAFDWAQTVGSPSGFSEGVNAVAVNGTSVYIAGTFGGPTVQFGSIALANSNSIGGNDAFVAKLVDAGAGSAFVWAQRAGGVGQDSGAALAVSGPSIYLTGTFSTTIPSASGSVNVPAVFGSISLLGAGSIDVFVAKLVDSGSTASFAWAQQAGGPGGDMPYALTTSGNSVYVAGFFAGSTAAFGTTTLANATVAGNNDDVFVAKLTDQGATASFAWAQRAGGLGADLANSVAVTGTSVYVAGWVSPPAAFGSQSIASPNGAAFLALLDDAPTAPTLTSFSPGSGPAGTSITVTGAGFSTASAVTFNGVSATSFTVDSPTQLTAVVPNGASSGLIRVVTATGTATSAGSFTVQTATANSAGTRISALALLPNPAHAAVDLHLPTAFEPAPISLLDALGRTVRTYPIAAHATTATLDLTGLAPGLYVVRCGAASGRLVVE